MRRLLTISLSIILLISWTPLVMGAPAVVPIVNAASYVLMDAQSGRIISESKQNKQLPIASITKIMTGLVAVEKGNLDQECIISNSVLERKKLYGTLIFLEPGEKFTLRDLIYASMLNSANDATIAVAEAVAGSTDKFIEMMNDKAKELGAENTHFVNTHGLSEIGHYSSAKDMALISRYAMSFPDFAEIVRTKERAFPRNKQGIPNNLTNHNKILWQYPGADGVKTGYTDQAGHTLVATATRDGRQLIVVILKGTAIAEVYKDAAKLFDYGFSQYANTLLAKKGVLLQEMKTEYGQLTLAPIRDVYGTLAKSEQGEFELIVNPGSIDLPVKMGEIRGTLGVYLKGELIDTVPLQAMSSITLPTNNAVNKATETIEGQMSLYWLLVIPVVLVITTYIRFKRKRSRKILRRRNYTWDID